MLGIITSTIFPSDVYMYGGSRTLYTPAERLAQTQETVRSLINIGIDDIYLADNSGDEWIEGTEVKLAPSKVYRFNHQHQYQNKGISEVHLLLLLLKHLPPGVPILKISGRYVIKKDIKDRLGDADLAVKMGDKTISTASYIVKNKDVYEDFLQGILHALYGYTTHVVGLRSLLRIIKNSVKPHADEYRYQDPPISIEFAAREVLRRNKFKYVDLGIMGVKGVAGGIEGMRVKE